MRDALVQIYLHFVWGTWDRMPIIKADIEEQIYAAIYEKSKAIGCIIIALGGMPDHIHLLVRFPSTISPADYIKEIKGSSSHLITHTVAHGEFFKWQGSYAVFSVSEKDVPRIKAYIEHQKEHHEQFKVDSSLEL